jgi:ABC-type oligopeptide transport system substrate-binding subunit
MKIKFITLAIACLAFASCNSKNKSDSTEDSTMVTDSASMNPDTTMGMETIDSTGMTADSTGMNNGTTAADSVR